MGVMMISLGVLAREILPPPGRVRVRVRVMVSVLGREILSPPGRVSPVSAILPTFWYLESLLLLMLTLGTVGWELPLSLGERGDFGRWLLAV